MATRRRRKRRADLLGALLILVALLAVGGGGFAYWRLRSGTPELDADGCPLGTNRDVTALLLDASDPLDPIQLLDLRQQVAGLIGGAPRYARIELYALDPATGPIQAPRAAACNPGDPGAVSDLTGNRALASRRFAERFQAPLAQELDRLLQARRAPSSPLLEAVQATSLRAFGQAGRGRHRLILVSDLLQHSPALSFYARPPDFEAVRALPAYPGLRPDLRGVEVEIWYLRRPSKVDYEALIGFWQRYVADAGGRLERVLNLQGQGAGGGNS